MKLVASVVSLALAALAMLAALNWPAIVTPTRVSLGFGVVDAPLGLILLGACAALTAIYLLALAYMQARALTEARRYAKELRAQRELADRAEASRLVELRAYLEGELARLAAALDPGGRPADARTGQLERVIAARVSEAANGLAAHLGEVEDKLDRVLRLRVIEEDAHGSGASH